MASVMVIQLMCSLQAFRGRNLPSVMNDGVVLMYATFTLTIAFGVNFAIVPFQNSVSKENSQCVAIVINSVVIVMLLYGQKAFRMLLYPKQNTKAYFHAQRMEAARQNANQKISMK